MKLLHKILWWLLVAIALQGAGCFKKVNKSQRSTRTDSLVSKVVVKKKKTQVIKKGGKILFVSPIKTDQNGKIADDSVDLIHDGGLLKYRLTGGISKIEVQYPDAESTKESTDSTSEFSRQKKEIEEKNRTQISQDRWAILAISAFAALAFIIALIKFIKSFKIL
jgi:hypothetical protein